MTRDEYNVLFHRLELNLVAFKRLMDCDEEVLSLVNHAIKAEREASIDAVLQIIKELRPALVLVAFADRDKAWAIDKIKENIEKLKEKPND
jgi:LmbE family N-acetylglucosaminyl deacetylase